MAKKPKTNHVYREQAELENTYETEVTFKCPVRGMVTQKVKVKKYRAADENYVPAFVNENDELDRKDDGLGIYGDENEVELD